MHAGDFVLINTGQHREYRMAQSFIKELALPKPEINLNCSPIILHVVLRKLKAAFMQLKVSEVYVIGDTDSALSGAIAAHEAKVPLVHIESGLRCDEPIPEEYNRRCIDSLANHLLAPEDYAVQNLEREHALGKVERSPNYKLWIFRRLLKHLNPLNLGEPYYLFTLHRQENVDNVMRFKSILRYVDSISGKKIWVIHPRAKSRIESLGIDVPSCVEVIEPLPYKRMIELLLGAKGVLTDSGGLVLEAYELQKPMVIFRKSIEWKHVLASNKVILH
jgi:UDP-N-acetylglucosamine 2-epimerase